MDALAWIAFHAQKNCMYCNTKTCVLLFEGFNLWLDGRRTLLPWNHGDNNQTHRRVEDSKKQHKLRAIDRAISLCVFVFLSFSPCLSPMCFQSAELKVTELLCDQRVYYSDHWPTSPQLTRAPEHWGPLYISCSLSVSIYLPISYSLEICSHVWQCKGVSRKEKEVPPHHYTTSSLPYVDSEHQHETVETLFSSVMWHISK